MREQFGGYVLRSVEPGDRAQLEDWVSHDRYHGFVTGTGVLLDSSDETRWGGAIGTGVEVGFAPNWTVGFEYDHLFMGTRTLTFTTPVAAVTRTDSIKQDLDLASVRVNYRWGGPVVAKY